MEGCLLGIPSIAFSQAYAHPPSGEVGHGHAARRRRGRAACWRWTGRATCCVNVNFPDVVAGSVKGIKVTRQGVRGFGGTSIERTDPRGGAYYWIGYTPRRARGRRGERPLRRALTATISVTPLHLDLTHEAHAPQARRAVRGGPAGRARRRDRERPGHAAPDRRAAQLGHRRRERAGRDRARSTASASCRRPSPSAPGRTPRCPSPSARPSASRWWSPPMTEALRVGPRMKVLEIGTGSGYQAAVLAKLARRVYTIERYKPLVQGSRAPADRPRHLQRRVRRRRRQQGLAGPGAVRPHHRHRRRRGAAAGADRPARRRRHPDRAGRPRSHRPGGRAHRQERERAASATR